MKYIFEEGDSVRIIANTNYSRNAVGDIGIFRKHTYEGKCYVDVPGKTTGNGNCTLISEIEPYEKSQNTNYEIY